MYKRQALLISFLANAAALPSSDLIALAISESPPNDRLNLSLIHI